MSPMEKAEDRRKRQGAKRSRDWYRSIMYCGDPGACGDQCRVCRHFAFDEWIGQVRPRDIPTTVSYDNEVVAYIKANGI